ncbi:ABC transporter permease [Oleiharenicola lentus]|uniref:ABC transporter permease n=1 Tax=Oleiharenicola lentus TaxID=2508720 RepID=A0A4Q1C9U5_9BACT|nr:FtsX-like permease family protein [Oleiharenicola lentus]RXK55738.1 ABC transporter permease [Oleiharenicola lentus]
MSPTLRIAFRFLTAKKRAMLMSLSCIVLGVGLFVVTQATTSGFEEFFIKTILGNDGAIRVEDRMQDTIRSREAGGPDGGSTFQIQQKEGRKYIEGIEEPKQIIKALREFQNVRGVSEVITGSAVLASSFKSETVKLFGIDIDNHITVSELGKQIVQGELNNFRTKAAGALIGKEVADRLQLGVGDSFLLESAGQLRRYSVSAVFQTGVSDIDKTRIYLHLPEARSQLKKPTGATFIQVSVYDRDRADEDALQMEEVLKHGVREWQRREKTWLETFRALRLSSAITVSMFSLIAGLAMFNTLAMIVMEKTKEIAILRSMGYTREDISQIFLWQATIVLAIGSMVGCILGAGGTFAVSRIPLNITGIFRTNTFIVSWSAWHYVAAVLTAVAMVMVASLIPARRAARLEPGDIIRGTST